MELMLKDLLAKLISFQSITPKDADCQSFMISFFESLGFTCQRFNNPPVANFFARIGDNEPLLVFAGHTDVVPVGDESKWDTDPFQMTDKGGVLYGRGVADMKGSLAAMMFMAARLIRDYSSFSGSLGFLITSGEEGDYFMQGTPFVMQALHDAGILLDFCIVGEPSSFAKVGDVIKIGRRGSLTGKLRILGKQGHVAYPHLADNPIHLLSPILNELTSIVWDEGNENFLKTSFQATSIHADGHASNVIPGKISLNFNFRFSPEISVKKIKSKVYDCLNKYNVSFEIDWYLNGEPFLTPRGRLITATIEAVSSITHQTPELSTSGGTSDARFIAPYGVEVVELGPVNSTIHQVNECVSLADLEKLCDIYYKICEQTICFQIH